MNSHFLKSIIFSVRKVLLTATAVLSVCTPCLSAESNETPPTNISLESQCFKLLPNQINSATKRASEVLIIIPDLESDASDYMPLAAEIMRRLGSHYAVAVLDYKNQLPTFNLIQSCIPQVLSYLQSIGAAVRAAPIHFIGHSFGGLLAQDIAEINHSRSLSLLASHLSKPAYGRATKRGLKDMQFPTMILGGSADGYTKAPWLFREFTELQKLVDNPLYGPDYRFKTPVILVKGLKNSHFTDGKTSRKELSSDLNLTEARDLIADNIYNFIVANSSIDGLDTLEAQENLEIEHEKTKDLFKPLSDISKNYDRICENGQQALFSNANAQITYNMTNKLSELLNAPPSITVENGTRGIFKAKYFVEPNSNWSDLSFGAFFGEKLVCQFLIPVYEDDVQAANNLSSQTCQQLNSTSISVGKMLAQTQDTWQTNPSATQITLRDASRIENIWEHITADIASPDLSFVSPQYYIYQNTIEVGGTLFKESTCAIISPANIFEWLTINSFLQETP